MYDLTFKENYCTMCCRMQNSRAEKMTGALGNAVLRLVEGVSIMRC